MAISIRGDRARRLGWLALVVIGFGGAAGLPAAPQADDAPAVADVFPAPDAREVTLGVATDGSLAVSFSEPVALGGGALELVCERSGGHALAIAGGPVSFTFVSERPFLPGEWCVASLMPDEISDLDEDDPPDIPANVYTWSFRTAAEPVVINELDAITPEGRGEFVELYDGGRGDTDLSGLSLVLYRGDEEWVYLAVGLDGYRTDGDGYFVIGDSGVAGADLALADGTLRDGPDAAAIYDAPESDFPRRSPIATLEPLDAVVYGPDAPPELLGLLALGQAALDEDGRGSASVDSNQRCPNGAGQPRETAAFIQNSPSPGASNTCALDTAPGVSEVAPAPGAKRVPVDAAIEVVFSEPVHLANGALEIACTISGLHAYTVGGDSTSYHFLPTEPFVVDETCSATVFAERIADADGDDPPDHLESDSSWTFYTVVPVPENVVINEVDADTPGADAAEFIELFDGGTGHTALDGLAIVLFNGEDDRSYLTVELNGFATNDAGYFLIANEAVTGADIQLLNGILQNGPDAVALVAGDELEYPDGTAVTTTVAIDALVYSRPTAVDAGLQALLNPNQPQVDENGRGDADLHSNQRCPNGEGGQRNTGGYKQNIPTPGAANDCVTDSAPSVVSVNPAPDALDVETGSRLDIEFDEPVSPEDGWVTLVCDQSGTHAVVTTGGSRLFNIAPVAPLAYSEVCTATIHATLVNDLDLDDPPDSMMEDWTWSFTTADPPADFVVINEIDANTPGNDSAEFIELYDGGRGSTRLNGLAMVFFNGSNNQSYRVIDLDGFETDGDGYFIIGNSAVAPDIALPDGMLQNGPDAVALFAANESEFPNGTFVHDQGLIDAIVYGEISQVSPELIILLVSGQFPVDEDARGSAELHSLQRCPNGSGEPRQTAIFRANQPTPGEPSNCITDLAPLLTGTTPLNEAPNVSIYANLSISFNEPVSLTVDALQLACETSDKRAVTVTGGPLSFAIHPSQPLPSNALCQVLVLADGVSDIDADDPPDFMANDYRWSFTTAAPPPDFVLINELDADTPGSDEAEFIELYDGGVGEIDLSGLVLVFYNGNNDRSYHAVDLTGIHTDNAGYLVIGNGAVTEATVQLPNGTLQNGADAVALYGGHTDQFPNGAALHLQGLVDAVVYGTDDPPDTGLLALLADGQGQVDEAGRGAADRDSIGRCPNGSGLPRHTSDYRPTAPTPGLANNCRVDDPPSTTEVYPPDDATDVGPETSVTVRFSEDVILGSDWFSIFCEVSGEHPATVIGGPREFNLTPNSPFAHGENCEVSITAIKIADVDSDDPPDHPANDFAWTFTTNLPPPDFVLINEVDSDTPGTDRSEFIELYDGGIGHTSLTGLVIVFWNGNDEKVYRAIDLAGYQTDTDGYFLLGNATLPDGDVSFPNGTLQNGPDAVSLNAGRAARFPAGTSLTTNGLIDAIVYGADGSLDTGLLALLAVGQGQVDEAGRGAGDIHSLQRCPNGEGGQRQTAIFRPNTPTPGGTNQCMVDEPPAVNSVSPSNGSVDVEPTTALQVRFNEDVVVSGRWFAIDCDKSGPHLADVSGGPRQFTLKPATSFSAGERCDITLFASLIADSDNDDPPDHPANDYAWTFTTNLPPHDFVLINEVDSDTPGTDRSEFIELYDGGIGHTNLTGLIVVFWNGSDDKSYRVIDLAGFSTNEGGYFVLGNAGVGPVLSFGEGGLQNGADAVSLHAGQVIHFPAGTPLTTTGLLDAVVYGTDDLPDTGLLALLASGQGQVDEAGRGAADRDSIGRCPNGSGLPRHTSDYRPTAPTPGLANNCKVDDPPAVTEVFPPDGTANVEPDAILSVHFSEDVVPESGWVAIDCTFSGMHLAEIDGGPRIFNVTPKSPFISGEKCEITLDAANISDVDRDDPPDSPTVNFNWQFEIAPAAPVADFVFINELDADTSGTDKAEFIELYDGGIGHTNLTGLIVVFWNGNNDKSYRAINLTGHQTNTEGYFLLGNSSMTGVNLSFPNGTLQNGPDAIGIYSGRMSDFQDGTVVATNNLIDAVAYGAADQPDDGLLALLDSGQSQIDEAGRGAAERDSIGRCPNGSGLPRQTSDYRPTLPTPGLANNCKIDDPPSITEVHPQDAATDVDPETSITVRFSEDVIAGSDWFSIHCEASGQHPASVSGGSRMFTLSPLSPFANGEVCEVVIAASQISDIDSDDPPDHPEEDYTWAFSTIQSPADFVLINELDADTPGIDTAEFIELYDGGIGHTSLAGLVVVFWNGSDDKVYRAIELTGYTTSEDGFFVLGNAGVGPDLAFGDGDLQNGTDAVSLHAGRAAHFPAGTPLTTTGMIDAIVYASDEPPDEGLLGLLDADQGQVDEAGRGAATAHSLQRCPDGAGGPRRTTAYRPETPTPGTSNVCTVDEPPSVLNFSPVAGAVDVAVDAAIEVVFSEDVILDAGWHEIACEISGDHPATTGGGLRAYTLVPDTPFAPDERCVVTLHAAAIHDADGDDPPDLPAADTVWSFHTAPAPPPPIALFATADRLWIGETAVFTNQSQGPGPLVYTWDFGDGSPAQTAAHPTHYYDRTGSYTVTLTAGGPTGTATFSRAIEVRRRLLFWPVIGGR